METRLKIFSVRIVGKPFINEETKPDKRFRTGYRVIGSKPSVSYTIDIITNNPDGSIRMGETVFTTLDTFRVVAVDNLNNKVSMKCTRITVKDDINFSIDAEMFFKRGGFTVGEGSINISKP